jgi:hypothetical protein
MAVILTKAVLMQLEIKYIIWNIEIVTATTKILLNVSHCNQMTMKLKFMWNLNYN